MDERPSELLSHKVRRSMAATQGTDEENSRTDGQRVNKRGRTRPTTLARAGNHIAHPRGHYNVAENNPDQLRTVNGRRVANSSFLELNKRFSEPVGGRHATASFLQEIDDSNHCPGDVEAFPESKARLLPVAPSQLSTSHGDTLYMLPTYPSGTVRPDNPIRRHEPTATTAGQPVARRGHFPPAFGLDGSSVQGQMGQATEQDSLGESAYFVPESGGGIAFEKKAQAQPTATAAASLAAGNSTNKSGDRSCAVECRTPREAESGSARREGSGDNSRNNNGSCETSDGGTGVRTEKVKCTGVNIGESSGTHDDTDNGGCDGNNNGICSYKGICSGGEDIGGWVCPRGKAVKPGEGVVTSVLYMVPEQTPPAVRLVLGRRLGWTEWDEAQHGPDEVVLN